MNTKVCQTGSWFFVLSIAFMVRGMGLAADGIVDPSFEHPKERDRWGRVFEHWAGWTYEDDCEIRVGDVAHSGKHSCLLYGGSAPKLRVFLDQPALDAGRYRITAYIRGLDIGVGPWNQATEFSFHGRYMQLGKNGTFGWTKLTYVAEVKKQQDVNGPSFGLMAPGYFWIDDVTMVRVGDDVPLTPLPILGSEEKPIEMPGKLDENPVRCPQCKYRNRAAWQACYACGAPLESRGFKREGPPVKLLTSFEPGSPFVNGRIVDEHATHGRLAWRLDRDFTAWSGNQDWQGYDYLQTDLFNQASKSSELYVEIQDKMTADYWTRVNYYTVIPPGRSTLVLPLDQLYVGEKSRPGRKLMLAEIRRLTFSIGQHPPASLFLDNIRLERDLKTERMMFDGLVAFDLGTSGSPVMPGFQRLSPDMQYSPGRGYGLKSASIWRVFDVLQPDPLYQDFMCFEQGGIAVDLPDGHYHVFVNLDNPSGYWGEYQRYRQRQIVAEERRVVEDNMDFPTLRRKYYRFWDVEDLPVDNTFDKYQEPYYDEREFDVEVSDGQLNLEFDGTDWACSVSSLIIYPKTEHERGRQFLQHVRDQRRFFFDNYFKRVLHSPTGDKLQPDAVAADRGYVVFSRDYMDDVYYNDRPRQSEIGRPVEGFAMAGELEPLTLSVFPLRDLGNVTLTITNLHGPGDAILDASHVEIGYVSNRIARVVPEGSVYTIEPRLIMPSNVVEISGNTTRRFWLTVRVPRNARPGNYHGQIRLTAENGRAATIPVLLRIYKGALDEVDLPVGPWGYNLEIPWYRDEPLAQTWNREMASKSLSKLREYGFTSFTGMPRVRFLGFERGQPKFDFSVADAQMTLARQRGFKMSVVNYCPFDGLNLYERDEEAMRQAGFTDYGEFIKVVFSAVHEHAKNNQWLPVYWNLGDEPVGDKLDLAAENARAYRSAFPSGPPQFTAATSFTSDNMTDKHFLLGKELHVANFNLHNEASVRRIQRAGADWAFYNGGNRWTYGVYMYKAAKQFNMKFRYSWHWNSVAGDPYYALDCREDDYAWCNSSPDGTLIPSVEFERQLREGLDDYRYMLTLARLADERGSQDLKMIITQRLAAFELGQRDHDELYPISDWRAFRKRMAEAIESLRN